MEKIGTILYSHHEVIEGTGEPENNDPRYIDYRQKWEELPLKKEVSEFPLHLDIEVTDACNLECPMCYRSVAGGEGGFMDVNLYKKIIDEGERYNLPSINLSWRGEPLLHPGFFDMVGYAKEHGIIDVRVNTNGALLDDEGIEGLIESGIDRVIFSVDGATKGTYEKIRIGSDFDRVTASIRKLVSVRDSMGREKPSVEVQIIDMKPTRDEIGRFIEGWETTANRISVAMYRNQVGGENDEFRIEQPYTGTFPCPQLWQRLVIGWDGKIYKCCGDNAGLTVLGDVREDELYDVWHGDRLHEIRELHKNHEFKRIDSCRICEFNKYAEKKKRWKT